MTEAALTLANLAFEKIPINTEFSMRGALHNILLGKHELYSAELIAEMNDILISRSSVVRDFLLTEKYITSTNPGLQKDILTEKGEKAKELGGHEMYKQWYAIQKAEEENQKDLQRQLNEVTLEKMTFENENKELTKELQAAQLSLAKAQEKDIPKNAEDRKTISIWTVAIAVVAIVEFVLLLFGVSLKP